MLGPGDRQVGNIICSSHNKGDLLQQWVAKKGGNGHVPLALQSFSDSVLSVFHTQKSSYSDIVLTLEDNQRCLFSDSDDGVGSLDTADRVVQKIFLLPFHWSSSSIPLWPENIAHMISILFNLSEICFMAQDMSCLGICAPEKICLLQILTSTNINRSLD